MPHLTWRNFVPAAERSLLAILWAGLVEYGVVA